MADLRRWTRPVNNGPFRFGPDPEPEGVREALRLRSDGQWLCDPEGRRFCTLEELHRARDASWRGLPCIVIQRTVHAPDAAPWDTPTVALWSDPRGIEDPESFRARVLGIRP